MAGVEEENRRRFALLLIALGGVLILTGISLGIHHHYLIRVSQELVTPGGSSPVPAVELDRKTQARIYQQVLFVLLILVGILSVSLYAFRVWSRRFRQSLLRKPAPPSPSEDVWAMHRLPEELLAESAGPGEGPDKDKND